MIPLIVLLITAASSVNAEGFVYCPSCILVNTTCYTVSYVLDFEVNFRKRVVIPKMALLRSRNTLFFSYEPVFEDPEYYKIGFVNLENNNSSGVISGGQVLNLGTFDIDQDNNLIYFGGHDGIWVLDTNTNKMSSYSSRGDTIGKIFYKNKVYFTKYNEKGIMIKNGDYFTTIYEDILVRNFVVTKYDVFVLLTNYGLFVAKNNAIHKISKNPYFRGLTIDLDGNIYAWWIDGLYVVVVNKVLEHSKIVKVATMPDIGAVTFDNDNNILFTSDRSLYVMTETKTGCEVNE